MRFFRIESALVSVLGLLVALEASGWAELEATYGDHRAGAIPWTVASAASLVGAIVALWLAAKHSAWNRDSITVLCACGLLISTIGTFAFHFHAVVASMGVRYGFDGAHRWLTLSVIGSDASAITFVVCAIALLYRVAARFFGKEERADTSA